MLISIGPGKWLNLQRILRAETKSSDSVSITYDVPHPHTKFVSETFTGSEAHAILAAIGRNDDTHQKEFEARMRRGEIGPKAGTGGATQAAPPGPGEPGNALEGEAGGEKAGGEGGGEGEAGAGGDAGAAAGASGEAAGSTGGPTTGPKKTGSATATAKKAAGQGLSAV